MKRGQGSCTSPASVSLPRKRAIGEKTLLFKHLVIKHRFLVFVHLLVESGCPSALFPIVVELAGEAVILCPQVFPISKDMVNGYHERFRYRRSRLFFFPFCLRFSRIVLWCSRQMPFWFSSTFRAKSCINSS